MSLAAPQDIIFMIPELTIQDQDMIIFYLNEAQRLVVLDGFAVTDLNFDILQRYLCGHLLFVNNIVRTTTQAESVTGGISTSYEKTKDENYTDQWWRRYIALKSQLQSNLGMSRVV